jgi:hypothetical protein
MGDLKAVGFWSYAHEDDESEQGRIVRLAELIQAEYAMLTGGGQIEIFVDRKDLTWGEEWTRRIDQALAGTTFLIPVVTPRFFKRQECRRELLTFDMHAQSRNAAELLMPLLYADVEGLEPESDDEAMALVARRQYERWTDLRLEAEDSVEYRRGVNRLARRLVEIEQTLAIRPEVIPIASDPSKAADCDSAKPDEEPSDEAPGLIDVLAASEIAMPRWNETIVRLGALLQEMGDAANEAGDLIERSDAQGKGFAGRLTAARQFARRIDPAASEFAELGTSYATDLVTVDSGFLTLIRSATDRELSDEDRRAACQMFGAIREMAAAGQENVEALSALIDSIRQTAAMSRDVRPPLRKVETALQRVMDGQAVMDEWVRAIDVSGIDCSDAHAGGEALPS